MEIIIIAGLCWLIGAGWKGLRRAFSSSPTTAQKQRLPSPGHGRGETSDSTPVSSAAAASPGKTPPVTTHKTDQGKAPAAEPPHSASVANPDISECQVPPTDPSPLDGIQFFVGNKGYPVSSDDRDEWLRARRTGVSATDARKIVLQNGRPSSQRPKLLLEKVTGDEGPRFAQFEHGIAREPIIAAWVEKNFGIRPNRFLCIGINPRHLATPDGIGEGAICEIKTSTKPLVSTAKTYRDQIQWQLHVTGVGKALFVVENRNSLEREHAWIERDEARIAVLAAHADHFLEELDAANAGIPFTVPAPVVGEQQAVPQTQETRAEQELSFPAATSNPFGAETHLQAPSSPVFGLSAPRQALQVAEPIPEWAKNASIKLLRDYDQGFSLEQLVDDRSWATEDEVLQELSRCLLNVEAPLNRKPSQRRKRTWTRVEMDDVEDMYYTGMWLPALARKLDYEQIEIAYALFTRRLPEVPRELIDNGR
ncbi:YqaJ viral recombinase family protein [Pseudarthrobacter sp. H2]|uniref:YqaJ viral recombinase family protein n=1 Tax=Pseudarthrobacter sp. H2 TaxID=3418415 RepID=UPI003CF15260